MADSFSEGFYSTCLPNTRTEILQDATLWGISLDRTETPIYHVSGMAGTGKSTISRTLAKIFDEKGALGASFFFKRDIDECQNLSKFFTSIAAGLAKRHVSVARHIEAALQSNPGITTQVARDQFNYLILQPIIRAEIPKPIIIIIDGLDECIQQHIAILLKLFATHSTDLLRANIKLFLTSRPEKFIRDELTSSLGKYEDVPLLDVATSLKERDISTFFTFHLTKIRQRFNAVNQVKSKLPDDWPGPENLQILVEMAGELFIFATTVCSFIGDSRYADPEGQLSRVLQHRTKSQESQLDSTYLPILLQQFNHIAPRFKNDIYTEFRIIVGSIILLLNPLSPAALSELLNMELRTIRNRLDHLHSVLIVQQSDSSPVRLLHLSFREFLLDETKNDSTKPFWVDEKHHNKQLALNCIRLLSDLKPNICHLGSPGVKRSTVNQATVNSSLSPAMQYSCRYWVRHVQRSGASITDQDIFHAFLGKHLLHWLEALSFLNLAFEAIDLIHSLQATLHVSLI